MDPDLIEMASLVWKWLKPQLPERPAAPKGGRPWVDDELCLRGIVWVLKTGARWKDMPKDLGVSYVSCWRRLADWSIGGVFQAAWAAALEELQRRRPKAAREAIVDGTFIRAKKGATKSVRPSAARG
jgi:transposase